MVYQFLFLSCPTTGIIGLSHRGGTSLPISTSAAPAPPFSAKAAAADKVIDLVANYVHVNFKSDIIVRQYHVDFTPKVDNVETRARLVADTVGPLFNQVYLYDKQHTVMSPADIPDGGGDGGITFRKELRPGRPPVELKFRRTSELSVDDEQMFHCLNMQLRDNMERMEQVQILRHYYDMQKRQEIAGQALEVIPGIVNSIKNCQAGLLMSLDTIHKVLHKRTVLDIIKVGNYQLSLDFLLSKSHLALFCAFRTSTDEAFPALISPTNASWSAPS